MEVIDSDQTAFLPLRLILDNIYLTHESIQWAKELHQNLIFLKLDFSIAYDRVDWTFMFQVVEKLEMPSSFINMIILLFHVQLWLSILIIKQLSLLTSTEESVKVVLWILGHCCCGNIEHHS